MSLADRLEELSSANSQPCKYARIIEQLRGEDDAADEFDSAVMERRISGSGAASALSKEGHFVADTVVRKHVVGECCCNR